MKPLLQKAADGTKGAPHAGDVARGAGMATNKTGRSIRRRHIGSRGPLGSHRGKIAVRPVDQPGPGRTGAADRAGAFDEIRLESELRFVAVLKDCGGRTRIGDSEGGRGVGRLGGFGYAAG